MSVPRPTHTSAKPFKNGDGFSIFWRSVYDAMQNIVQLKPYCIFQRVICNLFTKPLIDVLFSKQLAVFYNKFGTVLKSCCVKIVLSLRGLLSSSLTSPGVYDED